MRRSLTFAIALALLTPAGAVAAPKKHVGPSVLTMPWQNMDHETRPRTVWLAYQRQPDNGIPFWPRIERIHWTSYGGYEAVGTGMYVNVYWKQCDGLNGKEEPPTPNYSNCEKGGAGPALITETRPQLISVSSSKTPVRVYTHVTVVPAQKQGNDYAKSWSFTYRG